MLCSSKQGRGKVEVVGETVVRQNTDLQSGPCAEAQTPVFLTTMPHLFTSSDPVVLLSCWAF